MRRLAGKTSYRDFLKSCNRHGEQVFRYRETAKASWWVCTECLREQWRKSAAKKRKLRPEYNREYAKRERRVLQDLFLYLRLMLYVVGELNELKYLD